MGHPTPSSVLFLIKGDEQFGARSAVLTLARGLEERGVRVSFASVNDGPFASELLPDWHLGYLTEKSAPIPNAARGSRLYLQQQRDLARWTVETRSRLRRALRSESPDVLHVQWNNLVPLALSTLTSGRHLVVWETLNEVGRDSTRRLLRTAGLSRRFVPIANSHYVASTFGGRRPAVMHLGTDPARFEVADLENSDLPVKGVMLARFHPSKGHRQLLAAMQEFTKDECVIDCFGAAPGSAFTEELQSYVETHGLADRVRLLPITNRVEHALAHASFSMSLRVDPEPFGLSVIESLMAGRPALVHASGGPQETVVNGTTGWHIDGELTARTVAAGLRRVVSDAGRLSEMGAAARADAHERYTVSRQVARYQGIVGERLPVSR